MKVKLFFSFLFFSFFIFSSNGQGINFQWAKSIGGGNYDYSYCITVDSAGNVYSTGFFNGTVDFDPGPGVYNLTSSGQTDIYICKLNSSGSFLWAKGFGGAFYDEGHAIDIDPAGNVYTTGFFILTVDFDPGSGVYNLTSTDSTQDVFISKLDPSGNFVWAKQFGELYPANTTSIALDASGNVLTCGTYSGTLDFDPGISVYNMTATGTTTATFISKLDNNGNFIWAKQFEGNTSYGNKCITTDVSGNVYTTGAFVDTVDFDSGTAIQTLVTPSGITNTYISKLDSSGNFVWVKSFGQTASGFCYGQSIAVDAPGNVYVKGMFTDTVDFNPGVGIYTLTGPSTGSGTANVFISKLDSSGNFIWAKKLGGESAGTAFGKSITVDISGNVFSTGFFTGTADFDPGTGVFNLIALGSSSTYVSKLDSSGTFVWAKGFGQSVGFSLALVPTSNDDIYISGIYIGTVDFNPEAGIYNLTSAGSNDIYIVKIKDLNTDVKKENKSSFNLNIYPNPNNGNYTLTFNALEKGTYKIDLINQIGQRIYIDILSDFIGVYTKQLSMADYEKGIFLLSITNFADQATKKIIVR